MIAALPSFSVVLSELEQWASYERTASPRDISRLEGIRTLLEVLGHPERDLRVIHIAGTNGKGLTAKMLCSLLRQQGFSTGRYSSPHLRDIRERISLNEQWISRERFTVYAYRVLEHAKALPSTPRITYFDLLTAIALLAFHQSRVDWTVLETGLGGRADSTNVTPKELCILTRITYDHQDVLGNSLEQIALEKLGIARPGTPLVLAPQQPALQPWMLEQLREMEVPVIRAENRFALEPIKSEAALSHPAQCFQVRIPGGGCLRFHGEDQHTGPWRECLQTTLAAAEFLFPSETLDWDERMEALLSVRMEGRLDLRRELRWNAGIAAALVLDGGHNADALLALVRQLKDWELREYILILAFSRDKMRAELWDPLEQLCAGAQSVVCTEFSSPRSSTPEILHRFLAQGNCLTDAQETHLSGTPEEAFTLAAEFPERPLVFAGSFYLVGEILALLENEG